LAVCRVRSEHESRHPCFGVWRVSGGNRPQRIFARTQVTGYEILDPCAILNRRRIMRMLF
jgi:hypothetical protein